jgi:hypothetical protein
LKFDVYIGSNVEIQQLIFVRDPNVFTSFKLFICCIFTVTEIFTETSMAGYFLGRILGSNKRRQSCWRDTIILVSIMGGHSYNIYNVSRCISFILGICSTMKQGHSCLLPNSYLFIKNLGTLSIFILYLWWDSTCRIVSKSLKFIQIEIKFFF